MDIDNRIHSDKYERYGAYHWEGINPRSARFSLPLWARYARILECVPHSAKMGVEIGCGDGTLTYLLKQRAFDHMIGCDVSVEGITLAKEKIAQFALGDSVVFECKPFGECGMPQGSVDIIVLADVIEHIEDPKELLSEIRRAGKPGGCLIVTTPYKRELGVWDGYHHNEYTQKTLASLLKGFFSDTIVQPFMPLFFYKAYDKSRLILWLFKALNRAGINLLKLTLPKFEHGMLIAVCRF